MVKWMNRDTTQKLFLEAHSLTSDHLYEMVCINGSFPKVIRLLPASINTLMKLTESITLGCLFVLKINKGGISKMIASIKN